MGTETKIYLEELPNSCEECIFKHLEEDDEEYCNFTNVVTLNIGRQYDCPLHLVPTINNKCKDCSKHLENWMCMEWKKFSRPEGYCYKYNPIEVTLKLTSIDIEGKIYGKK